MATKKTKKKVEPKEKEDKSQISNQEQATYNAIGALTDISQSHKQRIDNLETHMNTIFEKLGRVLERMGL